MITQKGLFLLLAVQQLYGLTPADRVTVVFVMFMPGSACYIPRYIHDIDKHISINDIYFAALS